MATIAEIREKYPQYGDLSDRQLADKLHAKFYGDMGKGDFYRKVGLTTRKRTATDEAASRITFGLSDRAAALGTALGGEAAELFGGREASFRDRYKQAYQGERTSSDAYRQDNPTANALMAPLSLLGGGGLINTGRGAVVGGALAGGATGGLSAAGEEDATPGSIALNAAGGAGIGAAVGYAAPKVIETIGRGVNALRRPADQAGQELVAAGARRGVRVNPADVAPGVRNATAFMESVPGGSGPVQRATTQGVDDIATALQRDVQAGRPVASSRAALGESVQASAEAFRQRSRDTVTKLYTKAESLAGGATVRPTTAVKALDDSLRELSGNPNTNKTAIEALQRIRADLVDDAGRPVAKSIADVRNLRTQVRNAFMDNGLRATPTEAKALAAVASVSDDIARDLAANPAAARAYKVADRAHAARIARVDGVVKKMLGTRNAPVSAEAAASRINAMASNDSKSLQTLLKTVGPGAREEVAGTIADTLGRRAGDADFSPAIFLQQVRKISPEARVSLFGTEGAQAIDDLSRLSMAKVASSNALNRSRSGQVGNYAEFIKGAIGIGGYAAGGVPGAVGTFALGNVSGRLLSSPAFANWLVRGTKLTAPAGSQAASRHIAALSSVAAKSPALRNEVLALQNRLSEALAQSPAQVAAQEDTQR